ncbi:hypothetical protein EKE94_02205 [Mesobaculum littorinae]|uniref:ATP-dependent Clp protease proteolytic subunit n=1 Tax=Mesobaculum littorinae TaxID=2486419 RepID=A0A438ALU1_9RHOB|nr:hypothetical protein [Mesobaculum littorinae]RVV99516.1 hypothetical protein EKE94_02205 [Mesobaculum littorinae]
MSPRVARRRPGGPGRVLGLILGAEIAMAGALVALDLIEGSGGLPALPFDRDAPRLDQPVRPGDQTRRYDPADRPAPRPGQDMPATPDMPDRLSMLPEDRDGTPVLRLRGQIAPGDAARFADVLDDMIDPAREVWLNSPGGSVSDALEIGRQIRAAGLSTHMGADDVCLSACPYMLAGGTTREADADAYIGVHQHYFGQNAVQPAFMAVEDIQRGQGMVMDYLDEMGIDLRLMRHALVTPPDEIYILVPEELADYDLVTGPPEGDG